MAAPTARAKLPYLLAAAIWAFAWALGSIPALTERLENPLLDLNLRRLAARLPPDPGIVLLDIDESTLAAMAGDFGRYPWSRAVYGALIEGLARQQPAAIVFDILLTDPHREHAADDLYFIRRAQQQPNVYFPMVRLPATPEADRGGYPLKELKAAQARTGADPEARAALLLPLQGLTDTGRVGTINIVADGDAVIRRYPLYQEIGGWRIPSLPARVARDLDYAVPEGAALPLVWHGPARAYRTVSFHEVYFDLERKSPQRPANEFAGKIVIVGSTAPGMGDLKLTPMGVNYPGPEVIATALDNLQHGERLHQAPAWATPAGAAVILLALALAFARGLSPIYLGIGLAAVTVGLGVSAWLNLLYLRLATPVVLPAAAGWVYYFGAALRAYLVERRSRQRVTQLFGRFLDPRVVRDLVAHGETDAALAGQKRAVTVLFSDIRGFTTLSERKSPQEIVDLLNRYFSRQVEVIFRHEGTLDKYIGDAIMAFWGAPADQPDHAARALAAAREMETVLKSFKQELGAEGDEFDIGIGLNSGEAVVGFIGSPEHRQDYTVIGDTVNTASRIEGATKGRARILVSAATRAAAGAGFEFADHGPVKLKGKEETVHVYEPLWK